MLLSTVEPIFLVGYENSRFKTLTELKESLNIFNMNEIWLSWFWTLYKDYVIVISRTRFRVNLHSIVAWMPRSKQAQNLKVKWLQLDSNPWLSVLLRTKWFWVPVQLQSLYKDFISSVQWEWYRGERYNREWCRGRLVG